MNITEIMQRAKKAMLKNGHHNPMLFIESKHGVYISLLDFLPDTTLEKKMLLFSIGRDEAMKHDIEAKDVEQLTWICEAWFVAAMSEKELEQHTGSLVDHPKRQEGLLVLTLSIKDKSILPQVLQMVEVIRHGDTVDLLPHGDLEEVQSSLLTSCLAGICSASLEESELAQILEKYRDEKP
jgi:hypothetical protein